MAVEHLVALAASPVFFDEGVDRPQITHVSGTVPGRNGSLKAGTLSTA